MSVLDGVVRPKDRSPAPFRSVPFIRSCWRLSCCRRSRLLVWLLGSANPFTPASYVGY
jgi:hypothetical protein